MQSWMKNLENLIDICAGVPEQALDDIVPYMYLVQREGRRWLVSRFWVQVWGFLPHPLIPLGWLLQTC